MYAIISAHVKGQHSVLNLDATMKLEKLFQEVGIPTMLVQGQYKGTKEESILVPLPEPEPGEDNRLFKQAVAACLAAAFEFKQEAILLVSKKGLVVLAYTDATRAPDILGRWTPVDGDHLQVAQDYTRINGQYFVTRPLTDEEHGWFGQTVH